MKKRIIILAITVLAVAGIIGAGYCFKQPSFLFSQVKTTNSGKTVSYKGKSGETALELLSKKAKIKTNGTGKNAFVTTINGVTANSANQYWAFDINGKAATVGAGSYVTKDSDTITWTLTTF